MSKIKNEYKYYYIYKTTNLINNKIYIGQRCSNKSCELDSYLGSGVILNKSIKKHGIENFKKDLIEYVSKETINEREVFWIKEFNSTNVNTGYNLNIGGGSNRGFKHSDEAKRRIGESKKGKTQPEELKLRWSANRTGMIFSEETKIKMSESAMKNMADINERRKRSIKLSGIKRSSETRAKMKEAQKNKRPWNKGIPHSEEHKLKQSIAAKNREVVKCPHCNKLGQKSSMVRWHFDNCKYKSPQVCHIKDKI